MVRWQSGGGRASIGVRTEVSVITSVTELVAAAPVDRRRAQR